MRKRMLSSIHRHWLNQRMLIADKLISEFEREAEADAEILLCCVLSTLAATVWPKDSAKSKNIDQARFIQLLIEFSVSSSPIKRISVCILIQQLLKKKDNSSEEHANALINHFFSSRLEYDSKSPFEYGGEGSGLHAGILSRIIWPDEIDTNEEVIHCIVPELPLIEIRKASYAKIIYSDLRNGLVHEYELGENLTASGWHHSRTRMSYVNFIEMPDEDQVASTAQKFGILLDEARSALSKKQQRLYFPYTFIRKLTEETADSVFRYWDSVDKFSRPQPAKWWIEG